MRIVRIGAVAAVCAVVPGLVLAAADASRETLLETRWLDVPLVEMHESGARAVELPDDLVRPIGTTRWELTGLRTGRGWTRTIERDADGALVVRDGDRHARLVAIDRADAATDWLAPHLALHEGSDSPWRPAVVERYDADGVRERFWIRAERVGSGWVHLPSRPHEVVLQRVHVRRAVGGGDAFAPHRVFYRWVDPRQGVVAETEWSESADGALELQRASIVERVVSGGIGLRLYADRQQSLTIGFPVLYGFDRGTVPISSLDPAGHASMQDLYSASSWDFSGNNLTNYPGMLESASTVAPINTNETCSANLCGFDRPGAVLGREDKNWDLAADLDGSGTIDADDRRTTVNALEREDRAGDVTTWLRAVVRNQGIAGSLGSGESRLCYVDGGRQEVPLTQYRNQDAIGFYQQVGDTWSSGDNDANPATPPDPFSCENNTFNHVCPDPCPGTAFCQIYTKNCSGRSGTQFGEVLGEGPVTLPSGHTFNALVTRTVAEFCTYAGSSCFLNVQGVRTAVYLWQTPVFGTVVRVMSELNVSNIDTFTQADETDIKFGLFPPVSLSVGAITDTTVEISWDPGNDTHRIDGYHVYWDTDSGAATPYAFDQLVPAGQTSLVVTGLTPGTEYFFTVASMSDFTNPDTMVTTTYESVLFPQFTDAVPDPVPAELSATTTSPVCTPTTEITGVTASRSGADVELCWTPSVDPCVDGYRIIGAASPESATNFSTVIADTGPTTCATVSTSDSYYLVLGLGTGGTGPWGHYGQ